MRHYLARNVELFEELLLKFNRVEGLFVSKKWEVAQKSLTFKRLAFLVYSGNIDSFEFKTVRILPMMSYSIQQILQWSQ